jgi:hypothetical protein
MLSSQIVEHFITEVRKSFSFLHEEYAFSEPELILRTEHGFAQMSYNGTKVGIELVLDIRDEVVDCYVVKLIDSKFPTFNINSVGNRFRQAFFSYLVKYHNYRGCVSKKPSGTCFKEAITIDIKGFAQLLKQYGEDIFKR